MSEQRLGKRKNIGIYLIFIGLLIGLLAFTQPVSADPSPSPVSVDSLQQMRQTIDQQRSNLLKERDRLSDIEQAAKNQLGGIQLNIQATDSAYQNYDVQIQQANQRLREVQEDLAQTEERYYQKQAATIARLRFLQRQQRTGFGWDILLKSQNINEFLDRRRQVKLLYQADRQILVGLKAEAEKINQKKTQVEVEKNQIALLTQQLLAQKAQYQAQLAEQQQLIGRLTSNKQALEAAQLQLEIDSRNIGRLIRRQIATNTKANLPYLGGLGNGELINPSDGPITSGFGWRRHPILGYVRFHSGLDFGASYGSVIRAAESGRVIFAGWYSGYGNAVIINHGDGITTLYGHTSKLYVSEGQTVQVGQAIAAVGSTGLSTGPHLHFEVRKNGEPVDPMPYL
ncbi:MAG TPA: peptidoglycan DD-metalloendopeptidase family protein [Chroococcales cyanobacterium]|jgi:murein DD-endopeptidase MepM/ murein hydrolase activator NlpD